MTRLAARDESTWPAWLEQLASDLARPRPPTPDAARARELRASQDLGALSVAPGTRFVDGRLTVVRALGQGGMGAVYAAFDRERDELVALKTLLRGGALSVGRFKAEFRALADVRHANLVGLHELFHDRGTWFYTMELLDGVLFDVWVRAAETPSERLRRIRLGLSQLVSATRAIHAAGKLHRDLKPSNVMVTRAQRLVVLDFGLTIDRAADREGAALAEGIAGTPYYMAPEQAAGMRACPASDAYAIGVMLYEALTGQLPFVGGSAEVLQEKQRLDARPPSALCAGVPADLEHLCARLLQRDPALRPSLDQVALQLEGTAPQALPSAASEAPLRLYGRDDECAWLARAFQDCGGARRAGVCVLQGESGIGKSALVEVFLASLRERGGALVLSGRSFERESIPFKAFDPLLEHLSRQLDQLASAELTALLPRAMYALSTLFPALARAAERAGCELRAPDLAGVSAIELRRQAFSTFAALLSRLCERRRVVLHFDDLQWSDPDSLALLRYLLSCPEAPPVFVVLAHRSERLDQHQELAALHRWLREHVAGDLGWKTLGPLTHEAARALLAEARAVVEERWLSAAAGNPFLLRQLGRRSASASASQGSSLNALVEERVAELPEPERRLLETLAVAAGPIDLQLAAQAAGITGAKRALHALCAKQLARTTGSAAHVECFHDRFRESIVGALPSAALLARHRALACALQRLPNPDPEQLAAHLSAAGDPLGALQQTVLAARRATELLGFARAARLYAQALGIARALPGQDPADLAELWRARAKACTNAGDPRAAAQAFREAAALSNHPLDDVHAAEALWGLGATEEGKALVARCMRDAQLHFPSSAAAGLVQGWWWRLCARLPRRIPRADARQRLRSELCFTIGGAMAAHDPMGSYALQGRAVFEATRSGQPEDLVRALGPELLYVGATGKAPARTARIRLRLTDALAACDAPQCAAFVELMLGYLHFVSGELALGHDHMERARRQYMALQVMDWQYKMAARNVSWLLWMRGHYAAFREYTPALIHEAHETGDRLTWLQQTSLFTGDCLLRDDPEQAASQLCELRRTSGPGDVFGNAFLLDRAEWQRALYAGEHGLSREHERRLRQAWRMVWRFAHVRVEHAWFSSLSRLSATPGTPAPPSVKRAAAALARESLVWPRALGQALRAACLAREGQCEAAARAYAESAHALSELGFEAQAEAIALRQARLEGDSSQQAALLRAIGARGVHNPERWLNMMSPA